MKKFKLREASAFVKGLLVFLVGIPVVVGIPALYSHFYPEKDLLYLGLTIFVVYGGAILWFINWNNKNSSSKNRI